MWRSQGNFYEILHDVGKSITSEDDYEAKRAATLVSKYGSYEHRVLWAWKEDKRHVGSHGSTNTIQGPKVDDLASFVLYSDVVSYSIEIHYEWWRIGTGPRTIKLDLNGHSKKVRNIHSGLLFEIDFQKMVQINNQTRHERKICRQERYGSEPFKRLPPIPKRSPPFLEKTKVVLLPTTKGQVVCIKKWGGNKTWAYGVVVLNPVESTARKSQQPLEGCFPTIFCHPAECETKEKTIPILSGVPSFSIATFDLSIPKNWEEGRKGLVPVCKSKHATEWQDVVQNWSSTMTDDVVVQRVDRIQKVDLWHGNMVKKHSIEKNYASGNDPMNNSHRQIEKKRLFHGKEALSVPKIVTQGFNRSRARANGTRYGKGVCFAATSQYSSSYATEDSNGLKRMFVCRVMVGDYCMGRQK